MHLLNVSLQKPNESLEEVYRNLATKMRENQRKVFFIVDFSHYCYGWMLMYPQYDEDDINDNKDNGETVSSDEDDGAGVRLDVKVSK